MDDHTQRRLRLFQGLLYVALGLALVAAIALAVLALVDPEADSDTETVLAGIAAFAGLGCGILFAAAAIYAQVRGLWKEASPWVRYLSWGLLILLAVVAWGGPTLLD